MYGKFSGITSREGDRLPQQSSAIQEHKYVGVLRVLYRSFVFSVLSQQAWRLTRNKETKISSKAVKILVIECIVTRYLI